MDEFWTNLAGLLATVTAIAQVLDVVWYPLMNTIESSNHMTTTYGTLNEDTTKLSDLRNDYECSKKRYPTKTLSRTYNNWSRRVTNIETEVYEMRLEYETLSQSSRWFLLPRRSHFISQMKSKSSQVNSLWTEGTKLNVLVEEEPVRVFKMFPPDIKEFPTLQKSLEEILKFLTTDKFCVGVDGMKGIGKTTIMQNLNDHEVSKNFEIVIWIKVSSEENGKNLSLEQIQQEIVQRLKLNISTGYVDEVAHIIRQELKEKKYLLLLDDLREDIKLDLIGIHPNNEKSSKVVITYGLPHVSRLPHVWDSATQKPIKVQQLSAIEECKMFRIFLDGSEVMVDLEFERFESLILKYCAGLPLLIKMVGGALKMRDTKEQWYAVLDTLTGWSVEKGDKDFDELHKLLSFSSESLEGGGSHIGVRTPTVSPGVSTGTRTPLAALANPRLSVGRGIVIREPAECDAQRRETVGTSTAGAGAGERGKGLAYTPYTMPGYSQERPYFDLNFEPPNWIPDNPFQEGRYGLCAGVEDDVVHHFCVGDIRQMARSSPVNPRLTEEPSSSFQPSQSVHRGSQVRAPRPPLSPLDKTRVRKETPTELAGDTKQRKRQRQEQLPPES